MTSIDVFEDFYAVLQVPNTAPLNDVTKSYRRLAMSLHPDKNPGNPNATASFQLLVRAYETISDPQKRTTYDITWLRIKGRHWARNLRAETTQTAQWFAAAGDRMRQEQVIRQAEAFARYSEIFVQRQQQVSAQQERLRKLESRRARCQNDIAKITEIVERLKEELIDLQYQEGKAERKRMHGQGLRGLWASSLRKRKRESEAFRRATIKKAKEDELAQSWARFGHLSEEKHGLDAKIDAECPLHNTTGSTQDNIKQWTEAKVAQMRKEEERRIAREARERFRTAQEIVRRRAKKAEKARGAQKERFKRMATPEILRRMHAEWQSRATWQAPLRSAPESRNSFPPSTETAAPAPNVPLRRASPLPARPPPRPRTTVPGICRHLGAWISGYDGYVCGSCACNLNGFAFQCCVCEVFFCEACREELRQDGEVYPGSLNASSSGPFFDLYD